MDKQLHLEIYEVLRASTAFQDFHDNVLHDFVDNVKLNVLPALTSLDSRQCKVTERLFVVFKGRLIFAVKNVDAADEVLYELGPGDVIGVLAPIGDISLKGFNKPIKAFEIRWNV